MSVKTSRRLNKPSSKEATVSSKRKMLSSLLTYKALARIFINDVFPVPVGAEMYNKERSP